MFQTSPVTTWIDSPLGRILLAATNQGLCGAWFENQSHFPDSSRWAHQQHPVFVQAQQALSLYFSGSVSDLDCPLDLNQGTTFQQKVWRALLQIPRGGSTSYSALSTSLGKPRAQRAVGSAVGRNPLSIFVPCHRVLGLDGSLTGYAGGLERKMSLLTHEGCIFRPPTQHGPT
ncbi:MAG: methylated-DNA--[protein]-cysteine S-methyltransferase [Burkholderiaceae bacterium]